MALKNIFKERYSSRSYKDKPIPEEKLKNVLRAAQLAPSARNLQPYKLIVVKDEKIRQKLAKSSGQSFIAEAAVIIAGVSLDPDNIMSCEVPAYPMDLGIAMEHIALQAVEEKLGTCWIGAFNQKETKEILGVPEKYKIAALMPLGYPADSQKSKQRKKLEKLIYYNQFNN